LRYNWKSSAVVLLTCILFPNAGEARVRKDANALSRHRTQYFEMFGKRGIYHDGWDANTRPISPPWELGATPNPDVMNSYTWELYEVSKDWTQDNGLATANPAKLQEMQERLWLELLEQRLILRKLSLSQRLVFTFLA
jgi:arylsulfatase A-like enzyme